MNKAVILENQKAFCALGPLDKTITSLLEGRSGIVAGPACGIPVAYAPFPDISLRHLPATASALGHDLIPSHVDTSRTLFIYAAAKGDLSAIDPIPPVVAETRVSPILDEQAAAIPHWMNIAPAFTMVISCACASGAVALDVARDLLSRKQFSCAVIMGFDIISGFVVSGFHALNALSPEAARPFDSRRNGLTLGDCAAAAVLSCRKPRPGDMIIAGAASSNDANHRTGPSRTGEGLYRAARDALSDAAMEPSHIGTVKVHGTATNYNDAMEAKAICRLFGHDIPPCYGVKGAIGHTSGAGSLLEVILASHFIRRRRVPPTVGFEIRGVDEQVSISAASQCVTRTTALCLSAGFGGMNAAVVLQECDSE